MSQQPSAEKGLPEMIRRVQSLPGAIGAALDPFDGFLRCEECGHERQMQKGDAGYYTSKGWPKHCGYSMRWWTQRQVDAGEVPEFGTHVTPPDEGRS